MSKASLPDPTFKARMAYARATRRGSRKRVSVETFKATIEEAKKAIRPAAKVSNDKKED